MIPIKDTDKLDNTRRLAVSYVNYNEKNKNIELEAQLAEIKTVQQLIDYITVSSNIVRISANISLLNFNMIYYYLEGQRAIGLEILKDIQEAEPEAYIIMMLENKKEKN